MKGRQISVYLVQQYIDVVASIFQPNGSVAGATQRLATRAGFHNAGAWCCLHDGCPADMEALEVKRAERVSCGACRGTAGCSATFKHWRARTFRNVVQRRHRMQKHRAGPQASAVCQPVACMPPPAGAGASHHKAPSPKNPALLENFAASAGGAPAALRLSDRPGIAGPHMPLSNTQPEPPFARPAVPWAGSLALAPVGPALPLQRSSPGDLAQPLQRAALAAAAALSRATPQPLKQQQQGTLSAAQGLSQLMAARPASLNRADPAAAITVKPEPAAICRELRPTTPSAAPAPAAAVAAPAIPGPQPPSLASVLGKRKADGGPLDQPVPQQTLLPAPGALALGVPMLPHLSAASTAPVLGRPLASAAPPAGLLPAAQTPALYSYTRGVGGEVRAGTDEEEDGASAGVAWGVGAPPDTATAGEARKARLVWTQELQ